MQKIRLLLDAPSGFETGDRLEQKLASYKVWCSMRCGITSFGLWELRRDLAELFPGQQLIHPTLAGIVGASHYVGWGNKASGLKARKLARHSGSEYSIVEDGFLRSFGPGRKQCSASYVIDRNGVYYDAAQPSDLEELIAAGCPDNDLIQRAGLAISQLRERRLSKYNNSPLISLAKLGLTSRPYVLLLDQIPGDASIAGAGATDESFAVMMADASRDWPDHQLVVRGHPASTVMGNLEKLRPRYPDAIYLNQRCNIWPLLEGADHVYTVSSQSGFEALFCGKSVSCYGTPFYAGWGLTCDAMEAPRRSKKRSLEEVFACAYIKYSRYLDMHDRKVSSLENTIDDLTIIRDARMKNRTFVATIGMSPWKRRAVAPFLVGPGGKPKHFKTEREAFTATKATNDVDLAIWGSDKEINIPAALEDSHRVIRLEDGFLRSVGLGAAFYYPVSLVCDTARHLYFDARGPGTIEALIKSGQIDDAMLQRATRLRELLLQQSMTKYMLEQNAVTPPPATDQLKILVTGQVSDDASIRFGAPGIKSNTELITAVRKLFPNGCIAYREHPDVEKGLRPGKADRSHADFNGNDAGFLDLLDWCDRVETISSLAGFEALLRGKSVGVHGKPFYAGWGLTEDRLTFQPRGEASLETLVSAVLILYPDYIHPKSRLPCSPERLIPALAKQREMRQRNSVFDRLRETTGVSVGRLYRLFR